MSVEKVSYSSFPGQVYFSDKTKSQQSAQTSPIAQNTDKNSSNLKTIGAIAAGLAVIAAAGIAIASCGRIKSKNLSLDAFQKAGNKFIKGKAITKTGEGFTGVLKQSSKSGRTYVKRYENGLLSEVKIFAGKNEVSSRMFEYNTEGVVNKVTDGQGKLLYEMSVIDGKKIIKTPRVKNLYDTKTGRITAQYKYDGEGNVIRDKSKNFYYTKDGKKYTEDLDGKLTSYYPDGKTPEFTYYAGNKVVFYDKNGNVSHKMNIKNKQYWYDRTSRISVNVLKSEIQGPDQIIIGCNKMRVMELVTNDYWIVIRKNYAFLYEKPQTKEDIVSDVSVSRIYENTDSGRHEVEIVTFDKHGFCDSPLDVNVIGGRTTITRETDTELYDKIVNEVKEVAKELMKKYRKLQKCVNKYFLACDEFKKCKYENL